MAKGKRKSCWNLCILKNKLALGLTSLAEKSINRMITKPIMNTMIGERKSEDAMINMPLI